MIQEIELTSARTYKDRATAVNCFHKMCGKLGIESMCFIVVGDTGAYFCVAVPAENQVQYSIALAHRGISSVRR